MSVAQPMRIILENPPPFYTNLDPVAGRVVLFIHRPETIGAVVVKLEGEAKTVAPDDREPHGRIDENHKVLYEVQQVFPRASGVPTYQPHILQPGSHEFPFRLKLPFNNKCSDTKAMAKMSGGFLSGGVRVMDGSKQIFLNHVKKTLPPSFVAGPRSAVIRYYVKVTVQRSGFLNPNWRHELDFRFMPFEDPRPAVSDARAFAKRPFAFRPKAPSTATQKSLFGKGKHDVSQDVVPPAIEMCAWFPHPTILTCNKPVPVRLVATNKVVSTQQVYLTSILIELIGRTEVRCFERVDALMNRFIVLSNNQLHIPLTKTPDAPVGSEVQIPEELWRNVPLPNTVSPSFTTCNISRKYRVEIKLGVSWETPGTKHMFGNKDPYPNTQTIVLPLVFNDVRVFSGITPPPEVLRALANRPRPSAPVRPSAGPSVERPPQLPPRTNSGRLLDPQQVGMYPPQEISPIMGPNQVPVAVTDAPAPVYDPLYPPQVGTPGAPAYDEAPPSYDEAMAEVATGPADRPPFSGETAHPGGGEVSEKGRMPSGSP